MKRYTKFYRIKLSWAYFSDAFCLLFFNKEYGFTADFMESEMRLGIRVRRGDNK